MANGDSTFKIGVDSQASLFTNDSYGFGDFQDEDIKDAEMSEVEIVMPDGGLKEMDTDEVAAQENDSVDEPDGPQC